MRAAIVAVVVAAACGGSAKQAPPPEPPAPTCDELLPVFFETSLDIAAEGDAEMRKHLADNPGWFEASRTQCPHWTPAYRRCLFFDPPPAR